MLKFKIGDIVGTLKGSRSICPFIGEVVGFTKWRQYDAVKVKKEDGRITTCLLKNLHLFQEKIFDECTIDLKEPENFECSIPEKNLNEFQSPVIKEEKKYIFSKIVNWLFGRLVEVI